MSNRSEAGHVNNLASVEEIIANCKSFGAKYNPSRPELTYDNIVKRWEAGKTAIYDVSQGYTLMNRAVNDRAEVFLDLKPFSARIIGALTAAKASSETIADAKFMHRKITGRRAKKVEAAPTATEGGTMPDLKTISASQTGFDQQVESLNRLYLLAKAEANYNPNEAELSLAGISSRLDRMRAANTGVIDAYTFVTAARNKRSEVLYDPVNGLIQMAKEIKAYIKSVFGADSAEYKQVNALQIRFIRRK